jgi:DNA-binding CsgD family transcriptional regulator
MKKDKKKKLTKREKEVLKAYDTNLHTEKIADNLCISIATLYTHHRNILEKTGLPSIANAVSHFKDGKIS